MSTDEIIQIISTVSELRAENKILKSTHENLLNEIRQIVREEIKNAFTVNIDLDELKKYKLDL